MPQGAWLGPLIFIVMINDLSSECLMYKYLDDTTLSETVAKDEPSAMQSYIAKVDKWSLLNHMNINFNKTKEMIIGTLSKSPPPLISIDGNSIERVSHFKLLGVILDCKLKWRTHVDAICKRATSRLYFLKQLRRNCVTEDDLYTFYITTIRPVLEYACPAWHSSLTMEECNDIERIQKRALSIIYGNIHYELFCEANNIDSLYTRRDSLCRDFFKAVVDNNENCLHYLLPERRINDERKLRNSTRFFIPTARTERYRNSFILNALEHYDNS